MKPHETESLPISYKIDKELLFLTSEASEKYGEYKTRIVTLGNLKLKYFLEPLILNECYYSSKLEMVTLTKDKLFYLNYVEENNEIIEMKNIKNLINKHLFKYKKQNISLDTINNIHKEIFNNTSDSLKNPGKIRNTQNWIGPQGKGLTHASFIPPAPENLTEEMANLCEYINNYFSDPLLINIAISHAQFETLHPYNDGNGRVGRVLIPIQLASLDDNIPILYLSEILELYKKSYISNLTKSRNGHLIEFIKFFLMCVIEQCSINIKRLNQFEKILREDLELLDISNIEAQSIVFLICMSKVVFTEVDIIDESRLPRQTVSELLNRMAANGILTKDNVSNVTYFKHERTYSLFS